MKLVILGSGGFYPTDSRHTASYMIPELGVIFDAGTGLYRASKFFRTKNLHIIISHSHIDHLDGLKCCSKFFRDGIEKIFIYGNEDVELAIQIINSHPFSIQRELPYKFIKITENIPFIIESEISIIPFPLVHTSPCLGFRLNFQDKSMAYITDSSSSSNSSFIKIIKGINLLLHECYYPTLNENLAIKSGHSSSNLVIDLCKNSNISNLLLIHLNPNGNEEEIFKEINSFISNVKLAKDYEEIEF